MMNSDVKMNSEKNQALAIHCNGIILRSLVSPVDLLLIENISQLSKLVFEIQKNQIYQLILSNF